MLRILIWHLFFRQIGPKVKKLSEIKPPLSTLKISMFFGKQAQKHVSNRLSVQYTYISMTSLIHDQQ